MSAYPYAFNMWSPEKLEKELELAYARKESGFEVTDKIILHVQNQLVLNGVLNSYKEYICNETLAKDILFSNEIADAKDFDINGEILRLFIQKV